MKTSHQQFAAILFSDLKEYSKQKDNMIYEHVVDSVRSFLSKVKKHIIYGNTWGDGLVICCSDPSHALDLAQQYLTHISAYGFQAELKKKIEPRIGLHFGLVTLHYDKQKLTDISGEDVNFSARIEPNAIPNGITCSLDFINAAYKQHDRLHYIFTPYENKDLKNIGPTPLFIAQRGTASDIGNSVIQVLRNAVCYNQGLTTQYWAMGKTLHSKLEKKLSEKPSFEALMQYKNGLMDYFTYERNRIFQSNFDLLRQYFTIRNQYANTDILPRICLKTCYEDFDIGDLRRDEVDHVTYENSFSLSENTGMAYVRKEGIYYLCNNIPKIALSKNYINPRLSSRKVIDMAEAIQSGDYTHKDWTECWLVENRLPKTPAEKRACYRSTLIIPLTLRNNPGLGETPGNEAFLAHYDLDKKERAIYGYLCLDHQDVDYFTSRDLQIGYIFADLLSLYLLAEVAYTEKSEIFHNIDPDTM